MVLPICRRPNTSMESTHLDWCGLGNRRRRLTGRSNGRALEPGRLALTFGSLGKERKRRPEGRKAARRPFDWIQRASRSWAKGSHLRPIAGGASMEYHVAGPHGHKQKLEIQGGHGPCWPCLCSASAPTTPVCWPPGTRASATAAGRESPPAARGTGGGWSL